MGKMVCHLVGEAEVVDENISRADFTRGLLAIITTPFWSEITSMSFSDNEGGTMAWSA